MPITRAEMIHQIELLETIVKQWEAVVEPAVWYRDQLVKQISETVERHGKVLFDFVRTSDIDADARELALAIDQFEEAFINWLDKYVGHADVHPQGGREVWGPYAEMLIAKAPRRRLRPEPITQLISGNVPPQQIAKIYEWYTDEDWYDRRQDREKFPGYEPTPDMARVSEERAKPGTHYDPRTWVGKKDAARDRLVDQQWQQRCERIATAAAKPQQTTESAATTKRKHCPESLEELIALPGITPEQIAKMNPVQLGDRQGDEAVDFIRQRAVEMAVPLDNRTVAMAAEPALRAAEQEEQQRKQATEEMRLSKINSHGELPIFEDRIQAMLTEQTAIADIYVLLRREQPTLTVERIHEVANRAKKPKRGRRRKAPASTSTMASTADG